MTIILDADVGLTLPVPLAEAEGGTGKITHPLGVLFTSAEQTITAAGLLTIPHGLGVIPSLIQSRLICKTAEHGYAIGDEIIIQSHRQGVAANVTGISAALDSTNLSIRYGTDVNTFYHLDKATGASVALTNANWKLVVRAWS